MNTLYVAYAIQVPTKYIPKISSSKIGFRKWEGCLLHDFTHQCFSLCITQQAIQYYNIYMNKHNQEVIMSPKLIAPNKKIICKRASGHVISTPSHITRFHPLWGKGSGTCTYWVISHFYWLTRVGSNCWIQQVLKHWFEADQLKYFMGIKWTRANTVSNLYLTGRATCQTTPYSRKIWRELIWRIA